MSAAEKEVMSRVKTERKMLESLLTFNAPNYSKSQRNVSNNVPIAPPSNVKPLILTPAILKMAVDTDYSG